MDGEFDSGSKGSLKTNFQNLNGIHFKMRENTVMIYYNLMN